MYLVLRLCCTMMDIVNTRYTPPAPLYWLICPHQVELYSKDKKKRKKKKKLSVFLPVEASIISH